jgi:hypothetical protein
MWAASGSDSPVPRKVRVETSPGRSLPAAGGRVKPGECCARIRVCVSKVGGITSPLSRASRSNSQSDVVAGEGPGVREQLPAFARGPSPPSPLPACCGMKWRIVRRGEGRTNLRDAHTPNAPVTRSRSAVLPDVKPQPDRRCAGASRRLLLNIRTSSTCRRTANPREY